MNLTAFDVSKKSVAAVATGILLIMVAVGSKPISTAYAQPQLDLRFICVPYDLPPIFMKWWIEPTVTGLPSDTYSMDLVGLNGAFGFSGSRGTIVNDGTFEGQFGSTLWTDSPAYTYEFRFYTDTNEDGVPDEGGVFLSQQFDFLDECKGGAVEFMVDSIESMDLNSKVESSLTNSLDAAVNALDHGNVSDACNTLDDFIAKVTGFKQARKLTADEATELIRQTNDTKEVIGC